MLVTATIMGTIYLLVKCRFGEKTNLVGRIVIFFHEAAARHLPVGERAFACGFERAGQSCDFGDRHLSEA